MCSSFSSFRQRTDLSKENLKHLEKVFRNHLAKDNEEFTLAEFKQIVPSKNVSIYHVHRLKNAAPLKLCSHRRRGINSSFSLSQKLFPGRNLFNVGLKHDLELRYATFNNMAPKSFTSRTFSYILADCPPTD